MANVTILEPMSTGDVIDRAVRLYRRNFVPLLSIVAVPSLIYYFVSLMFWFGMSGTEAAEAGRFPASALLFLVLGGLGYPIWFYAFVLTLGGMSRVIGDHVMLGEAITLRKCIGVVRKRLGDLTLMTFLMLALGVGLYMIFAIIVFGLVMVVGVLAGATMALNLPAWLLGTLAIVVTLLALAAGAFAVLWVLSRVIFLPQVVMIEGQAAGAALGRAMALGGGTWFRLGAIAMFGYFVNLSLLAAMTIPALAAQAFFGELTDDFFTGPVWNLMFTAFQQVSSMLVLPIFVSSFTLLYFDSRVRRDAYDIELLAREIAPGFYWQAPRAAFGYPAPAFAGDFVQTSPLGLAGPAPRRPVEAAPAPLESPAASGAGFAHCGLCGAELVAGARFCIRCGGTI